MWRAAHATSYLLEGQLRFYPPRYAQQKPSKPGTRNIRDGCICISSPAMVGPSHPSGVFPTTNAVDTKRRRATRRPLIKKLLALESEAGFAMKPGPRKSETAAVELKQQIRLRAIRIRI